MPSSCRAERANPPTSALSFDDQKLLKSANRIDLIFTDVVLAGELTGRDVAAAAEGLRSGVPVLFTTGDARDAIVHNHRLDPGVELLGKPFTANDLGNRIAKLLTRVAITNPDQARIDGTSSVVNSIPLPLPPDR